MVVIVTKDGVKTVVVRIPVLEALLEACGIHVVIPTVDEPKEDHGALEPAPEMAAIEASSDAEPEQEENEIEDGGVPAPSKGDSTPIVCLNCGMRYEYQHKSNNTIMTCKRCKSVGVVVDDGSYGHIKRDQYPKPGFVKGRHAKLEAPAIRLANEFRNGKRFVKLGTVWQEIIRAIPEFDGVTSGARKTALNYFVMYVQHYNHDVVVKESNRGGYHLYLGTEKSASLSAAEVPVATGGKRSCRRRNYRDALVKREADRILKHIRRHKSATVNSIDLRDQIHGMDYYRDKSPKTVTNIVTAIFNKVLRSDGNIGMRVLSHKRGRELYWEGDA